MGRYSHLNFLLEVKMPITGTSVAAYELVDPIQRLLFFVPFPLLPAFLLPGLLLPLISELTGFLDWALVTRWDSYDMNYI